MKKAIAIIVLGLLLSSNAYTASVDDCDGTKSNSTTVKYECKNLDTMTVAAGTLIKKNWVHLVKFLIFLFIMRIICQL